MMKLGQKFAKLDVLAPGVSLNVAGDRAVKTKYGALLSIVYFAAVIYVTAFQIKIFLDTTSPSVNSVVKVTSDYPAVDIFKEKHIPLLMVVSSQGNLIKFDDIKHYLTIRFRRTSFTVDESESPLFEESLVPVVRCGDLIEQEKFEKDFYKNLGMYKNSVKESVCFDPTGFNTTIDGSYTDIPSTLFALEIYPCTLEDTTKCKSVDEVNGLMIVYVTLEPNIDLSDKTSPVSYSANSDYLFKVNSGQVSEVYRKLTKVSILDDSGFTSTLFNQENQFDFSEEDKMLTFNSWRNYSKITCNQSETMVSLATTCSPYLQIETTSSNRYKKTYRSYKGLFETLGEIGGLKELIFLGVFIFYKPYQEVANSASLVSNIFGIKYVRPSICSKKQKICRKKQPAEELNEKLTKEAEARIEESLDVINLVKELEFLKFISRILWSSSYLSEIPLLNLKAHLRKVSINEAFAHQPKTSNMQIKGTNSQSKTESSTPSKSIFSFSLKGQNSNPSPGKDKSMNQALDIILEEKDSKTHSNSFEMDTLQKKPDQNPFDHFHSNFERFLGSLKEEKLNTNHEELHQLIKFKPMTIATVKPGGRLKVSQKEMFKKLQND